MVKMRAKWKTIGALAVGLAALPGCVYTAAVPSVSQRAFVIKNNPFGSTFWNCDVTKGSPVCYKVIKVAPGQAPAAQGD